MKRPPNSPKKQDEPRPDGALPVSGEPPADASKEPPPVERWEDEGGQVPEPPEAAAEPEPDYKDRWLRSEAELQNFRRRAARDREESRRVAEESVLLELVTVLDDLERALGAADASAAGASWLEGVQLVAQRMRDILARAGVQSEDPLGRPFDPAFHEALLEVDPPEGAAAGSVVQVIHKGYRRGERSLRPARVVVARAAAGGAA